MRKPVYLSLLLLLCTCWIPCGLHGQEKTGTAILRLGAEVRLSSMLMLISGGEENVYSNGEYKTKFASAQVPGLGLSAVFATRGGLFLKCAPGVQHLNRTLKYDLVFDGGGMSPHSPAYHYEYAYKVHYRQTNLLIPLLAGAFLNKGKNAYFSGGICLGFGLASSAFGTVTKFGKEYSGPYTPMKTWHTIMLETGVSFPGEKNVFTLFGGLYFPGRLLRYPNINCTAVNAGLGWSFDRALTK